MTCAEALRKIIREDRIKPYILADQAGLSRARLYALANGAGKVTPAIIDAIAKHITMPEPTRIMLHRMAAREAGWEIGE